jgi:hypothetical protein
MMKKTILTAFAILLGGIGTMTKDIKFFCNFQIFE